MARRLRKTLLDYLVIAINPALIMAMVGSLVFFLVLVFYQGSFQERLQYIFALFVFAAVLIARISIEEGRERAMLFAIPLGIVTLLAINKFVQFQGEGVESMSFFINITLLGLIWWSADKLTWDCTLIDDSEEDSGEGLLEAAGLERSGKAALQEEIAPAPAEPEATTSPEEQAQGWWQRFIARRRRPHTPGVWIVYFSLAALPLFGIGQLFIPADDLSARQYAFQLLCVYTASGLGLLLATSFLGLRRYLRQRWQEMPLSMVNLWLTIGGTLIVGVMLAAMLLPRPNPEYAISELPFRIGSPDQRPSPSGTGREGVKEKQSGARGEQRDGDQSSAASSEQQDKTQQEVRQKSGGKGKSAGSQQGETAPTQSGTQNQADEKTQGSGESTHTPRQIFPHLEFSRNIAALANYVKWIFYGALALLAIFSLWRNRQELFTALTNFGQWFWNFWHNLFGKTVEQEEAAADEKPSLAPPPRRFIEFTDPFAAGTAGGYAPEELVRYTFEALEAWAWDHSYPRQMDQTPHEFARSLASNVTSLGDEPRRLADLYCQVAYAPGTLPAANVARLSHLWRNLRTEPADAELPGK
jgi:hypothetical protein